MNRRQYVGLVVAGTTGAIAGCMETVEGVVEALDDMAEEPDASGSVNGSPESFTVEAEAGNDIHVNIHVRDEGGGGRGQITMYGPDGDRAERASFSTTVSPWEVFTVREDGQYRIEVSPQGDRRMRLRVSVSVTDPDE